MELRPSIAAEVNSANELSAKDVSSADETTNCSEVLVEDEMKLVASRAVVACDVNCASVDVCVSVAMDCNAVVRPASLCVVSRKFVDPTWTKEVASVEVGGELSSTVVGKTVVGAMAGVLT